MSAASAFALACVLKASVVLALAAGFCACAGRASAALRHRAWALAIVSVLLLPLLQYGVALAPVPLAASAPAWSVPLLPAATRAASAGAAYTVRAAAAPWWRLSWLFWIWMAGACLTGLRLAAGWTRLWCVSRRARVCRDPRLRAALQQCSRRLGLRRAVRLRLLPEAHGMPCTWGWLRPVVLLPAGSAAWPEPRRTIVLLHELAHVQRRDWLLGLLAEVLRALYWFHPLAWLALRHLRQESERACDDAVLAAGQDPACYAGELLRLVRHAPRYAATALAVARPSHLARRITAMLDTTTNRRRLTPKASLVSTAAALLLLLPLAALRAPGQNVAGRFSGAVTDPRGAAVPSATVIMINPATHAREMTATDAGGVFRFEALPAGEYDLRVLKPGFAEYALRPMVLDIDRNVVHNVRLAMGGIEEQVHVTPAPAPAASGARPSRVTVGGPVQAAALTLKVVPTYPASAKAAGTQGSVLLAAVIGREGVPESLQVMNAADPELARAAVEAVSQWRYRPTLLNGEPIEVQTDITVNFTLAP